MYGRCTNGGNYGCHREGKDGILNPIMSAKLSSKASIKYGRIEIVAKMPRGDWLWPGKSVQLRARAACSTLELAIERSVLRFGR